jgi:hypothetical protein
MTAPARSRDAAVAAMAEPDLTVIFMRIFLAWTVQTPERSDVLPPPPGQTLGSTSQVRASVGQVSSDHDVMNLRQSRMTALAQHRTLESRECPKDPSLLLCPDRGQLVTAFGVCEDNP